MKKTADGGKDGSKRFFRFKKSIASFSLPEKFTNPFDYEPHPLCLLAVEELQEYLKIIQKGWEHNFGFDANKNGIPIGKMFGVLIVQNQLGELGYLATFSGKLSGKNDVSKFVPSIFDVGDETNFLTKGMRELDAMSAKIAAFESTPELLERAKILNQKRQLKAAELEQLNPTVEKAKLLRAQRFEKAKATLSPKLLKSFSKALKKEQQKDEFLLKKCREKWDAQIRAIENAPNENSEAITFLKNARKAKSVKLQNKLFAQYRFSNQKGESKDLNEIFQDTVPSAGSGECAAPKLLQYAFENQFKIIAMAEFWWGKNSPSQNMKHGNFYPACQEKCVPILGFMLEGIE